MPRRRDMLLDRIARPARYAVIGAGGGALGIVLARLQFPDRTPGLWVVGLFAVIALVIGIQRDRLVRRERIARAAAERAKGT